MSEENYIKRLRQLGRMTIHFAKIVIDLQLVSLVQQCLDLLELISSALKLTQKSLIEKKLKRVRFADAS